MENSKDKKIDSKGLRVLGMETYSDDMVKTLERNNDGLIKKIIQEQKEKDLEKEKYSIESRKNQVFLLLGLLFFVVSIGVFVFSFLKDKQDVLIESKLRLNPILFTERTSFIPVDNMDKDKIIEKIRQEKYKISPKSGAIQAIYLTEEQKPVNFEKFISLIKGNVPNTMFSLVQPNFIFGLTSLEKKDLFILLKVKSFSDIFPEMMSWENKIFLDLHSFFDVEINALTNELFSKSFDDYIVQNKNARILLDSDGNMVLLYIFIKNDFVLIVNNEDVAREVIDRINSSKVRK